ncbi:MAG TPA: amino acid adenylation domain-containing protein [Ktedonobacteraceae bacterium]|nr:amino acid adenylation domain-containing protein [Ktedonobacteraceae bacterium]
MAEQCLVIVDPETHSVCADDEVGEIWISGSSVTQGYWMRSEENAETFQAYLADGSGPFMRTGDLAFICQEQVFIAGRIKDLIIIRGRNHYPQDIELTVEGAHPALRRSAGAAFSIDIDGQEQLIVVQEVDRAYSNNLDAQEIFQAMRASILRQHELQTYAIALIKHNSIPKTSSGKIQRRACRQQFLMEELSFLEVSIVMEDSEPLDSSEDHLTRDDLLAAEPQEQLSLLLSYLATQVSRILKVDVQTFALDSHLSAWGLDSLKASSLKSQLESDLGIDIPVVMMLQDPQVGELARLILAQLSEQSESLADGTLIEPQELRDAYPLSFSQEQIWFLTQFDPESAFYNMPFLVRIKGKLSLPALEWSINKIVERHETLRMTFDVEDGFPIQRVQLPSAIPLVIRDLAHLAGTRLEEEVTRLSYEETARLFDLSRGPLLRVMVIRLHADEYQLQITFHHITCDGWSMSVLMQELRTFYQAYVQQNLETAMLPDLTVRYTDYVLWHRDWLQGERLEEQLAYWQRQLQDLKPLELPTDRQRPPIPSYQGETIQFTLPDYLRDGLKSLGHQVGATFFMVMVSTLMLLLARYSGRRDIAVGTLVANRTRKEVERLIGCFINTLVLRGDLAPDQSFMELLQQMRQTVLDAYAHQDVAFEKVVEKLRPDRHLSHFPFFQVMLVLQSFSQGGSKDGEVTFEPFESENNAAIHDLYISATETAQGIDCLVRYSTDIFERSTIMRLLEHWQTLMEGIVADPRQRVSAVSMLNEAEYRQIVTEWNDTVVDYPLQSVYQQLFSAQVQRTPQAPAVTYCGKTLSYQELDLLSNRLAHALRERGVGPEVLVGIYMERSLEMLVSILAIFKAGGAYLPLDLYHPAQRVRFILNESQTRLIITQPHLYKRLEDGELAAFALDEAWQAIAAYSDQPLPVSNTPENLAYVIYTSGSTGLPKGAMICQQGMINHLMAKIDALHINANDILAQNASQCFDISVWQFLAALLVGGQTHIVPDEVGLNPASLFGEVVEDSITILELVPAYMQAFLDYIQERGQQSNPRLCLRWIVPTGEACSLRLANYWFRLFPHIPLLNVYGTTESSDDTLHAVIESSSRRQWQRVPIGRPVPNTQVYVLDEQLAVVPIGVPGSIYLGGVCVGRGYLNDPVRTALAFIPSPFIAGERLYKTGDLGYYLPDGQIGFIGRVDHQIKLRGYRIELGEIEAVLDQHQAVKESVVSVYTTSTNRGANDHLVAYVVKLDQAVSEDDLRTYLLQKLPEYMCPSHFVSLESLPLTANGKIDRRSLPTPETITGAQEAFVAPRNALEEMLVSIWQQVLGHEQIGVMDNFFQLGGHSLLAAQMLTRLREQLNVDIPLRRMFEEPTIAALASLLEKEHQQLSAMDRQR